VEIIHVKASGHYSSPNLLMIGSPSVLKHQILEGDHSHYTAMVFLNEPAFSTSSHADENPLGFTF